MSSQSSLNDISNAIRQEIIRFESVHPNIYAIYDLIDAVEDKNLAESLRQLVVSIEDAFVNSQEWTLSNGVPGIKLGLLGSVQSGKSALVHRYLTGAYVHDESPEGGRFKKELSLDNQSHLLLIRDEGGPPDLQFSQWVDGVIFVFSLENIESYQVVYDYYARLSTYRSTASLPIILVGTQDSNCEPYVRVIDDARARKLANDLKRCAYYETCAAYGLNVERVFQDACLKILQLRASGNSPAPRPVTPQISSNSQQRACANSPIECVPIVGISQSQQSLFSNVVNAREGPLLMKNPQKRNEDEREREKKLNGIGSGRAIPLKQGFLYKRTCKPLSKEWKTKKYVTLTDDARLTYHPSIHDYMDNSHGKEIDLSRTTVKIPGVAFRQVGSRITSNGLLRSQLNDGGTGGKDSSSVKKRHRRIKSNPKSNNADGSDSEGYEFQLISMDRQWHFEATGPDERDEWVMYIERAIMTRLQLNESSKRTRAIAATGCTTGGGGASGSNHLSNVSGLGSGSGRHGDSNSLNSSRCGAGDANELAVTEHLIQSIRSAAGNDFCADCGAPEPDWASLNLGAMVCISCSGIHRQLGTHISRIRSLHLDEWSTESVTVMSAIGNTLANSVWEAAAPVNAGNLRKPNPSSSREEKEIWIRAKYQHREFLPPLPYPDAPLQRQLIDAIARQDTRQVILCLALATPETVNAAYSLQDPRAAIHIAATLGNLVYLQLLLWYNGDPTVTDHEGRNAFYYAHCSKNYDCADFLLRNSCPKQLVPPIPPNNMPPTIRSSQNIMPQQIVQSHSIIHGPSTSTGLSSGVADINISNSINSGLVQPHHFSHLQQHQSSAAVVASEVGTHLSGQLPSYHPMTTGSVTANQQLSQVVGSNHPLVSASGNIYTGNVNQALGATLPRRRAPIGPFPPGAVPPTLQPFPRPNIQQQISVSNTHRPTSSVIQSVTRPITPNAMLRTSLVSSSQPPHTRSASNTAATLSQPYVSTTQEVGL
ncbi:unnamed protein product [Schistosoma guineensis]|nr:unnamed protein product [Schistosoma guineensis]